jgi:lipid-binding SYLF domain-containing protein
MTQKRMQSWRTIQRSTVREIASGIGTALLVVWMIVMAMPSIAAASSEQRELVEKARLTLEAFGTDSGVGSAVREWKSDVKALIIVPQLVRGAFVFGGAGGSGVAIVRDNKTGAWTEPAFYTMGSASFGLQFGGDVSEIVMVVRTQKGLEQLYRSNFKLGVDVALALGSVGEGVSVRGITADVLVYAKKKGVYGGASAEGAVVAVSDDSNYLYYGQEVRPTDILIKQNVSNPHSAGLRSAASKLMQ